MHEDRSEWFWARVARGDGCWEWQRAHDSKGYGQVQFGRAGRMMRAHRIAWELTNGPIPPGLLILHHCDNRACVRPDHLFLGTFGDNSRDAMSKGRLRGCAIGINASDNRGSRHGMAKLTEDDVRLMRQFFDEGATGRAIAVAFGVSAATVSQIRTGKRWRHV